MGDTTKTSDEIKRFIDFINASRAEYASAFDAVGVEDKRTQDLLHAIEFEPHAEERSKLCTKLKRCRETRRENKDRTEVLEPIMDFIAVPANKKVLDQLTQLLGRVRKVEKYHENRSYIPRVEK